MNTPTFFARTLSTLAAAAVLVAFSTDALACEPPEVVDMDNENLVSWNNSIEGTWTQLPSAGFSASRCWKKDVQSHHPQVMFEHGGKWYLALGESCSVTDLAAYSFFINLLGSVVAPGDPTTSFSYMHSLRDLYIEVTADDAFELRVSGNLLGTELISYANAYFYVATVRGGYHTVEIDAWDVYGGVAGMAASVEIEGCPNPLSTTTAAWEYDTVPSSGAFSPAYDVSSDFGDPPGGLALDGADYIWWSPDATALGEAIFRLQVVVP